MEELVFEDPPGRNQEPPKEKRAYRRWPPILESAAEIINCYDTGVTLRQLFYRLVSEELLPNTNSYYHSLSRYTAEKRRVGTFPELIDLQRSIHRYNTFTSAADAKEYLRGIYRRDRTEDQEYSIYLGIEKAGIVEQMMSWFGDLGVPIVALGGYASQSYVNEIVRDVERQERPAVLLYAGDFDASGEDIYRDFVKRSDFDKVIQVALTPDQVIQYSLPELVGKPRDTRSKSFAARHAGLVQVELDALPPDRLRSLYQGALDELWDISAFESSVAQERNDLEGL